jgi:hypothetical protein
LQEVKDDAVDHILIARTCYGRAICPMTADSVVRAQKNA